MKGALLVGTLYVGLVGCASEPATTDGSVDSGTGSDGGMGSDGGHAVDSGACTTSCTVTTPTCGTYLNGCGAVVSCGLCAFSTSVQPRTAFYSTRSVSAATSPSGVIEVAYDGLGDGLHVAHWSAGSWTDELAVAGSDTDFQAPSLAIGPDGTRWLAYVDHARMPYGISVTHAAEGGTWMDDGHVSDALPGTIAVGSDGAPVVAFPDPSMNAVFVARLSGSTWTAEQASSVSPSLSAVAIVMRGSEPAIAFGSSDGLFYVEHGTAGWTPTTLDGGHGTSGPVTIALDAAGEPAVIAADPSMLTTYRRTAGAWTHSDVAAFDAPFVGSLAGAFDAADTLWLVTGNDGAFLANLTPTATPVQRIHSECLGGIALARDGAGEIVVFDACVQYQLEAHVRQGPVPAAYQAECDTMEAALCTGACTVCSTTRCCWSWSGPSHMGDACQSPTTCALWMAVRMCGDVTVDAPMLDACRDAIPSATCDTGHEVLPTECAALY